MFLAKKAYMLLAPIFVFGIISLNFLNLHADQWHSMKTPADRVFAFTKHSTLLFAGSENSGVWMSENNGQSWQALQTGLFEMNYDVSSFHSNGADLYAGLRGGGVCRTRDGGRTWASFNEGFSTQSFVAGIQQIGSMLFAAVESNVGLQDGGVYVTSVDKAKWERFGSGLPTSIPEIGAFVKTQSNALVIGTSNAGARRGNIYVSTDAGRTWLDRRIEAVQQVTSIEVVGNMLFAATTDGIYVSSNLGENWSKFGLQGKYVDKVISFKGLIYAAVDGEGVFATDSGYWWLSINHNLPISEDFVSAFFVYDNILLASLSAKNGVWALHQTATGIQKPSIISGLVLGQSYPNPAPAGMTTVPLELAQAEVVSLSIVDAIGCEVQSVFQQKTFSQGKHAIEINASALPGGVYFYRLVSKNGIITQPMIVQ